MGEKLANPEEETQEQLDIFHAYLQDVGVDIETTAPAQNIETAIKAGSVRGFRREIIMYKIPGMERQRGDCVTTLTMEEVSRRDLNTATMEELVMLGFEPIINISDGRGGMSLVIFRGGEGVKE